MKTPALQKYSAMNCFIGSWLLKACLAMVFMASLPSLVTLAESDVIVLTDPTTDRQYPFPI
jgi:hypothetical protein